MRYVYFRAAFSGFLFLFVLCICQQKIAAQTALVTGASRGIGLSLTQQLLEDKIKVIAIVRDKASLNALYQKYPHDLEIIEADLSSIEEFLHITNCIQESKIDYLVHNAAIIEPLGKEALIEAPLSSLNKILQVNLLAPILLTASLNSKLVKGSRILNISSRAGEKAGPGLGMYCISKAGLDMYTESLQLDHPHGILSASVHPGEVDTGMQEDLRSHDPAEFPYSRFFQENLQEKKLISPDISAKFLKWLLIKTTDESFVKSKHNIYDTSHHLDWHTEIIPCPY